VRGLTVGEQSSTSNPLLQLFARDGGFLTDIVSGSFRIENIRDPGNDASTLVGNTALTVADKVGTGRYAIPTGATTAWLPGTHRVVCSYVMATGGPTYTQVIEFEVLNPTDWPSSASYVGYLSTRQAVRDGYVDSDDTPETAHRHICDVSRSIENWTKRWFDPRYMQLRVEGAERAMLLLDVPIIAMEDIYSVWQTTSGEDTYLYEQYLYKVFNRHLSHGEAGYDDRQNPKLRLTNPSGTSAYVSGFAWPYGNQNIRVQGVFGYTDPDQDPHAGEVLIGHTPTDLARAVGALITRQLEDPTMSNPLTWSPGSVKTMKTRYQSITFGGSGGGSAGGGGGGGGAFQGNMSGDPMVDSILLKYCRQPAFGAI
jgi:hypothetical protein